MKSSNLLVTAYYSGLVMFCLNSSYFFLCFSKYHPIKKKKKKLLLPWALKWCGYNGSCILAHSDNPAMHAQSKLGYFPRYFKLHLGEEQPFSLKGNLGRRVPHGAGVYSSLIGSCPERIKQMQKISWRNSWRDSQNGMWRCDSSS